MCNLYTLGATRDEVAAYFRSIANWRREVQVAAANHAQDVYPGYPGLVLAGNELRAMNWGFPLAQVSTRTGKPIKPKTVNNARDDKLSTYMWRYSFEERRCLMPMTAYAEAEGPPGRMTRTWISTPDSPIFACAAIWKHSDEWGEVYSMVTTPPPPSTAEVHDRAPLILRRQDYRQWLEGTPDEAFALCVPYGGPVLIDRTVEPWNARKQALS